MSTNFSTVEPAANGQAGGASPGPAGPMVDAALVAVTREFHNLIADIEDLVQATSVLSGEELARVKVKLQARVVAARTYLGSIAGDMSERVRVGAKSTDDYVRAQPWRAIGITAGAGLLLGFLLGRRR